MPRTEHPFGRQARRRIMIAEQQRRKGGRHTKGRGEAPRAKSFMEVGLLEDDDYATPETSIDIDPRYLEEDS